MRAVSAIILKQLKDTFKNKEVLIQFIMFPLLAVIMDSFIIIDGMPENFFVNLFATMYIGMAPLTSMSAVISEEKEKNTLRVLMLSDVTPLQYLAGVGSYIWCICMIGAAVFCATGNYTGKAAAFMTIMAFGILVSLMFGAAIGTGCRNQMSATSVTVPVMMIFAFLPMLGMFNDTAKKIARLTYSEQISTLINGLMSSRAVTCENIIVIALNIVCAAVVFFLGFRRSGIR